MTNQAGQILNVFTGEEIANIHTNLEKLHNSLNAGDHFFAYTNGFRKNNFIII